MSTKKYLDIDGLLHLKDKLDARYVGKVSGKGLSTNDLTNELKASYDSTVTTVAGLVAEGGEPNVIETVKVNGTALTPDANKAVNVTVPTKVSDLTNDGDGTSGSKFATESYVTTNGGKIDTIKVNGTAQTITNKAVDITVPTNNNQLTNGAGYQTASDVTTAIGTAIAGIQGISYSIVASLPATGQAGVIYLVSNSGSGRNIYDEYIYVNNAFEKIGTTEIDLSGYVQETDLVAITNAEIDTIVA